MNSNRRKSYRQVLGIESEEASDIDADITTGTKLIPHPWCELLIWWVYKDAEH